MVATAWIYAVVARALDPIGANTAFSTFWICKWVRVVTVLSYHHLIAAEDRAFATMALAPASRALKLSMPTANAIGSPMADQSE